MCDPDAEKVFKALRKAGVKLGVVSNFDTRLRPLMRALNCDHWFDAVAVSAEVCPLISSLFYEHVSFACLYTLNSFKIQEIALFICHYGPAVY